MLTGGRTDRRTDMTELIVALRNFANAPNNKQNYWLQWHWHRDIRMPQTRPPAGNATGIRLACSVAWELI